MADLEKLAAEAAARAVVTAGRDAATKALDDILPPEGDDASGSKGQPKRSRRWWILAAVVLGLCLVIGLVGLVVAYWYWFLLAGVVGSAALVGYFRLRKRLGRGKKVAAKAETVEAATIDADAETSVPPAALRRVAAIPARHDDEAEREARAEREIDDDLAAMKARLRRER